jgi:hypothetical protein
MRLLVRDPEFLFQGWNAREWGANHVVYADERLVERCSQCFGGAGTNAETACHTYAVSANRALQ